MNSVDLELLAFVLLGVALVTAFVIAWRKTDPARRPSLQPPPIPVESKDPELETPSESTDEVTEITASDARQETTMTLKCAECGTEAVEGARFCHGCGGELPTLSEALDSGELERRVDKLEQALQQAIVERSHNYEEHLQGLARDLNELIDNRLENRLPKTAILADSFWVRAWAVYGHALVPGFLIGLGAFFLGLLMTASQ